jgi:ABC-type amino acid transport substrate-binding protein
MTDKSVFSDDEWRAIVDAPLRVSLAMFAAGEHGPISMVKEASASARALARPGDRGAASALIAQISSEAEGREARHDARAHHGQSMDAVADTALSELQPAVVALRKLPDEEAAEVAGWFVDIARAVAAASKGVNPKEQATIDKIAAMFAVKGNDAQQM